MSDSDSSDGDILLPNGFNDVRADLVDIDFEAKSCDSPPRKKKKKGKKGQTNDSFDTSCVAESPAPDLIPGSPCPPISENDDSIYMVDDEDMIVPPPTTGRGTRRSKRNAKTSSNTSQLSSRTTRNSKKSNITVDLNESDCVTEIISPEPSPLEQDDIFDVTPHSSFCFDVEDEAPETVVTDPNVEVKIRVLWKGCNTDYFNIRKFQKIKEIYEHYAKKEGVEENRILFTLRDKTIHPNDTPASLSVGVSSLEGGVVDAPTSHTLQNLDNKAQEDPNALKLQIQRSGVREKHVVYTYPHEKISVMISKLSEELNIPAASIKLMFDGDELSPDSTPNDHDMEGDECVDLITKV